MDSAAQPNSPADGELGTADARTGIKDHPVRIRPAVARQHLDRAVELTDAGLSRDAVTEIITALSLHPGMPRLYHQLGHIFNALGLKPLAQTAFRGEIPAELLDYHYGRGWPMLDDTHSKRATAAGVERHLAFKGTSIPLPPTTSTVPPVEAMFETTSIEASDAHVHVVAGGALWFDGHNRLVLSRDRSLLTSYAHGNATVVHDLAKQHTPEHVSGRVYVLATRGFNNFYHWLVDILPGIALFDAVGLGVRPQDRVVVANADSAFHRAAFEALGIGSNQIVETSKRSPYISADELVVPQFSNAMGLTAAPWIVQFLGDTFLGKTTVAPLAARRLYLARPDDARNGRAIGNQDAMIRRLEARGYKAVFPERYPLFEQAALFAAADIVVASHGAGLTNIAFCRPGTAIVELFGQHQAPCYWAMSALNGLHHHSLFCSPDESDGPVVSARDPEGMANRRRQGFDVDLDALETLLSMAERTVETDRSEDHDR